MLRKLIVAISICILSSLIHLPARASLPDQLQVITVANANQIELLATYDREFPNDLFNSEQIRITFTQDSDTLYYSTDTAVVALNLKTGDTKSINLESAPIGFSFDISRDNKWLVLDSSGDLGGVYVYDFQTQKLIGIIACSGGPALAIHFSPIEPTLFAVYTNENGINYLDFWRIRSNLPNGYDAQAIQNCKPSTRLIADSPDTKPFPNGPLNLTFSPNGQVIMYYDRLLNAADYQQIAIIPLPQNERFTTTAISDSGQVVTVTIPDKYDPAYPITITVYGSLWGIQNNRPLTTTHLADYDQYHLSAVTTMFFSPNDEILVLTGSEPTEPHEIVWLWDAKNVKPLVAITLDLGNADKSSFAFSPDGKLLVVSLDKIYVYGVLK